MLKLKTIKVNSVGWVDARKPNIFMEMLDFKMLGFTVFIMLGFTVFNNVGFYRFNNVGFYRFNNVGFYRFYNVGFHFVLPNLQFFII